MLLPVDQREALVLIGAGPLSYEEGAAICGCAVGTMKSRVSRARTALQAILDGGAMPRRSTGSLQPSEAFAAIMDDVEQLTANGPAGGK
jgi:RNA polymerase sigma-70 factor (ECF subfamily)